MLTAYLSTLLFAFMMSIAYGIYKLAFRLIDGHSFFVPNKENLTVQPKADDVNELYYRIDCAYDRIADLEEHVYEQTPDPIADYPINDEGADELYSIPEEQINPELVEKNRLHDEKIERLKAELVAFQEVQAKPHTSHILDENSQRVGVVFDEDHAEVDSRYIPKPTHEYTD